MSLSALQDTFVKDHLPPESQWPVLLLDNPDVTYPKNLNAAVELLSKQIISGNGDRIALRWIENNQEKTMSYQQLDKLSNQIAQVFIEDLQLVSGNRLLLRSSNNHMLAATWLGALKAGLVAVATMPLLRSIELKSIIDKGNIQAAVCDASLLQELQYCQDTSHENHCPQLTKLISFNTTTADSLESLAAKKSTQFEAINTYADDVSLIAFTSGTTGKPKGCVHFHRDILAMCDTFAKHIVQLQADDIVCGTPPLAFTFGLGGLLCFPLRAGASTLFVDKLTPDTLLKTVEEHKVSCLFTAPTFYRKMAEIAPKYDLRSLRKTVSAGEALPDSTRRLWKQATGIEMIDGIGGTELIHVYISSREDEVRPGSIGKVVPGFIAEIVDDNFQPVPPNTVGRLRVRGPVGCRYLDDTRQLDYVKDGWNMTGDSFMMDEDGYFFFQARCDDMIVSAGYNISAPEVEDCLLKHPDVAECAVIGSPDPERGQIIKAFIIVRPGVETNDTTIKDIQDFVKNNIAPYKYPRKIEFVEMLPRTETGKLQRFKLRQ